jgi:hypothetical protein
VFGIAPPTAARKVAPSHPPPLVLSPHLLALLEGEDPIAATAPSALGLPPPPRGARAASFMRQPPSQEYAANAAHDATARGPGNSVARSAIRHILHVQRACPRDETTLGSGAPYIFGAR